jgi:hypothetical protein
MDVKTQAEHRGFAFAHPSGQALKRSCAQYSVSGQAEHLVSKVSRGCLWRASSSRPGLWLRARDPFGRRVGRAGS